MHALRISKAWGRDPGWFEGLPRPRQVQLLAYERVLDEQRADEAKRQKGRIR